MELFALVLIGVVIFVIVGAVLGTIAKARTTELADRLERVERELRHLRATSAGKPSGEPVARDPLPEPPPPLPPIRAAVPEPPPVAEPVVEPEPVATPVPVAEVLRRISAPWPVSPPEPPGEPAPSAGEPTPTPSQPPVPPPAPTGLTDVEQTVGLRWLTWVGVGLLFLGVAFFLKYAYDRDWLGNLFGPRARITTAALASLTLGTLGWRSLRNGMTALGQGLLGGGQALAYLTVFAAYQPAVWVVDEPWFGATTAFVLLAMITALGLGLAVRLDAVAMAFLAVLGGFATPVLVSTGGDSRDTLCTYLLLLDLGVLAVAALRRWRALDVLAFVGTALLFTGWYLRWQGDHPQPDATLLWLGAFHGVFLLLPFVWHWRQGAAVPAERFAMAVGNVAWATTLATHMLRGPAPGLLAAASLLAAAAYAGLGLATVRRVGDTRTGDGFLGLGVLQLTLGLFHLLPGNAITTAWFAEAATLLWLGYRFGHLRTRQLAHLVLVAAAVLTIDRHLLQADPAAPLLWNRWCLTLLAATGGLGAFGWLHRRHGTTPLAAGLAGAHGLLALWWGLLVGSLDLLRHAEGHAEAWPGGTRLTAVATLQLLGATGAWLWHARWRSAAAAGGSYVPWAVALLFAAGAYDSYPATAWPVLNGAGGVGLGLCAVAGLGVWVQRRHGIPAPVLRGICQLSLTAYATVETLAFLQRGSAEPTPATLASALGAVWLAAAFGGGLAAWHWRSRRLLVLAAVPAGLAICASWLHYGEKLEGFALVGNARFLLAFATAALIASGRPVLQRLDHAELGKLAAAAALVLALGYGVAESLAWTLNLPADRPGYAAWLLGATALVGSVGGLWRALATDNRALRGVALVALWAAVPFGWIVFLAEWPVHWMFANPRALLVAATAGAVLWWRRRSPFAASGWLLAAIGFVGCTAEPPAWLLDHVVDPAEAGRAALFSITVTWVVGAAVLLAAGFRWDRRPLRLGALLLFAATAAKLLLLDMSGAQQLYRILAFVLVGLVFVGASWLYHRAERRLRRPPAG